MVIDDIKNGLDSSGLLKNPEITTLFQYIIKMYNDKRISNTSLLLDGDMLLFQWGTYNWGSGRYFNIDITRQVMDDLEDPDEQADSMRQLSVTLLFLPNSKTDNMSSDDKWCHTPDELPEFKSFIEGSEAYKWAAGKTPDAVEVDLFYV